MRVLSPIVLLSSAAILYSVATLFYALYQWRCPRCRRHGLRCMGGYVWRNRDRGGVQARDQISYYLCRHCSARLRREKNVWADVGEEEWNRRVKNAA